MLVGCGGAATTISGKNGARNGRIQATASQDSAAIMGLWRRYRAMGMSCEVTMGLKAADGVVASHPTMRVGQNRRAAGFHHDGWVPVKRFFGIGQRICSKYASIATNFWACSIFLSII
jgi:hypothetical protein